MREMRNIDGKQASLFHMYKGASIWFLDLNLNEKETLKHLTSSSSSNTLPTEITSNHDCYKSKK